jgi:hypothetical protein
VNEGVSAQIIISPDFYETIEDLKKATINIRGSPYYLTPSEEDEFGTNGGVTLLDNSVFSDLDPEDGHSTIVNRDRYLCGYDESMLCIPALEGIGYFFSHSLVLLGKESYLPVIQLSFRFYTRSKTIANGANKITYCADTIVESKRDYVKDKRNLIENYVPAHSVLLLDGPLVGSQITSENVKMNRNLLQKDIIPLFVVKNSESLMVVNSRPELKDRFNSDLEWAYRVLKKSQMTPLFYYQDSYSSEKNKVFTYLKIFDSSPVRVEFHRETYEQYKDEISKIFNIISYQLLSQGDPTNPQPRIVAIAEEFARRALDVGNVRRMLEEINIVPTMNATRFGWRRG